MGDAFQGHVVMGPSVDFELGTEGCVNSQRLDDERVGSSPEKSSCGSFSIEQFKQDFVRIVMAHTNADMLYGGIASTMQEAVAQSVGAVNSGISRAQCTVSDELLAYREAWTIDQAKAWCRSEEPAYSAGFIGSSEMWLQWV